jgi:hypothetical protein
MIFVFSQLGEGIDGVAATRQIRAYELEHGIEPSLIFGAHSLPFLRSPSFFFPDFPFSSSLLLSLSLSHVSNEQRLRRMWLQRN